MSGHFYQHIEAETKRQPFSRRHFHMDLFNENVWRVSIKISLKFVPRGLINNTLALVQIMAVHRSGDKPLSEQMIASLQTHKCVTQPQWVNILLDGVICEAGLFAKVCWISETMQCIMRNCITRMEMISKYHNCEQNEIKFLTPGGGISIFTAVIH